MGSTRRKSVKRNRRKALPKWDTYTHTLFWQDQAVKHFNHEAMEQEKILAVLEKAGWPNCLDTADLGISKKQL